MYFSNENRSLVAGKEQIKRRLKKKKKMTEKTREYQLQMEWTTGGILRKFQEISERQFSSTIATRFLSFKSNDSLTQRSYFV